jgi:hypothetical protein
MVSYEVRTVVKLMPASSSVNITALIDRCPLSPLQIRIIELCGLMALLDGFDVRAIGISAPAIAGPLHVTPNQFGFLFSEHNAQSSLRSATGMRMAKVPS